MSYDSAPSSPPKRPRLSLQIKAPTTPQVLGKSVTALKVDIDPSSPTAFNTLSNAYAAAIENSSPKTARPLSAGKLARPTSLRLQTTNVNEYVHPSQRTQTPGPFSIAYPDTPTSAIEPTTAEDPETGLLKPIAPATAFTFTPPQSAGTEKTGLRVFTFSANSPSNASPSTPRTPRRRMTVGSQYQVAPYSHPRSLHSILRNSPLPPRHTATPITPSRASMRLADRAAKQVEYKDPLTQTITTNKYVRSHIDLLIEDSPASATDPELERPAPLDLTMAYTGDETRDGGQTPGPFEEMRRRMADHDLETPKARKQRRKEKKRKWEWTITNTDAESDEERVMPHKTPVTALIAPTPITAIRRAVSVSASEDSEMSEVEERFVPSNSEDSEMSERESSVIWEPARATVEDERPRTTQSL